MKALTRAALIVAIASFTSLGVGTSSSAAASDQTMTTKQAVVRDGSHDFDFIYGKWRMPNHRLKERLAGSHEWVNFITCDGGDSARRYR